MPIRYDLVRRIVEKNRASIAKLMGNRGSLSVLDTSVFSMVGRRLRSGADRYTLPELWTIERLTKEALVSSLDENVSFPKEVRKEYGVRGTGLEKFASKPAQALRYWWGISEIGDQETPPGMRIFEDHARNELAEFIEMSGQLRGLARALPNEAYLIRTPSDLIMRMQRAVREIADLPEVSQYSKPGGQDEPHKNDAKIFSGAVLSCYERPTDLITGDRGYFAFQGVFFGERGRETRDKYGLEIPPCPLRVVLDKSDGKPRVKSSELLRA